MSDQNKNIEQSVIRRTSPFLAIIFFYFLGFFITRKSDFDSTTTLGIIMLVFGWICILLSMMLSVITIVRIFKEK